MLLRVCGLTSLKLANYANDRDNRKENYQKDQTINEQWWWFPEDSEDVDIGYEMGNQRNQSPTSHPGPVSSEAINHYPRSCQPKGNRSTDIKYQVEQRINPIPA
jgi:hypothetical protein